MRICAGIDRSRLRDAQDAVFRVLTRQEMKTYLPNCVGVGSPFIVHDPDTYERYMLFTAWSDVNGVARELWTCSIGDDLELAHFRKLADGGLFNVAGLNTATAFWDDYNEQWVFACTAYGAAKQSYGYFIFFDRDWNVKGKQVIDFEQAIGAEVLTPNLGDAGIGMIPDYERRLVLSCGFEASRALYLIDNYTSRPLPRPKIGNAVFSPEAGAVVQWDIVPRYYMHMMDVHQLLALNGQLVMLSEAVQHTNLWRVVVCFGPEKDWNKAAGDMVGKYAFVSPITWSTGINYTHVVANQIHPHYTSLLGEPLLFFATAPCWNAGGKRAWAHEVWAQRINPSVAFDPRKQFPLVASGKGSDCRFVGKIGVPTFGASTATIELYGVSAPGKLTVVESASPLHIWSETAARTFTEVSIPPGSCKITIDRPAAYIALKTDVMLSEWNIILRGS